jgi:hypothetical protein
VLMIFLRQNSERTIRSLVPPPWLNAPAAAVNRLTGCTRIRDFVMAVTSARIAVGTRQAWLS